MIIDLCILYYLATVLQYIGYLIINRQSSSQQEEIMQMEQMQSYKKFANSQLQTAINCLIYGIHCFYFDRIDNKLYQCLLTIHEEYINIIHIIIQSKSSFLFQLQHVQSISNKDIFVRQTLKNLNLQHFIIVYTSTLESFVLAMQSENQINVLWEGLQYFIYEAKNFYSRISQMDPFKAETTMLFMDADADGSKLLDIQQLLQIFNKLKIYRPKNEIQQAILQINKELYQKQNLKQPKDFSLDKLTPLGFQYILQYYSMKGSLAPLFTELCPIFKYKHKQFKKSIIDILKSQMKPLMSAIQFQQFMQKYMKMDIRQQQCRQLIKTFPIYDGQGKEIPQQIQFLSFHNFCNYVFSPKNSIFDPAKQNIYQNMNQSLNQYYVYSSALPDNMDKETNMCDILQYYEISIKKGCRCIQLGIYYEKDEFVVRPAKGKMSALLVDVLKTIKNIAFTFNHYPLIFSIQLNFQSSPQPSSPQPSSPQPSSPSPFQKLSKLLKSQMGQYLYIDDSKRDQTQLLPSPQDLKDKIILQIIGNNRKLKQDEMNVFYRLVTLMPTKLDFQRKGLTNWDTCHIPAKDVNRYEEIQSKNLTDYCRKIMVRSGLYEPSTGMTEKLENNGNYDPMPMFRNGVQIMAHNVYKEDEHHFFIHSQFVQNGGRTCGYLEKPTWMKSNCKQGLYISNFNRVSLNIKMKVYAGQKYVLADTSSTCYKLEIFIKGLTIEEQKNKRYTSDPKNEGFYTDFQMQCQFAIYCPDLASLVFCIMDDKNKILSYRAIPINTIREGLRTVELLGPGMEMNANSCLLVEVVKTEEKVKKKMASLFV